MLTNKSKTAFRTIAEVGEEIGVEAYVLRFWETKFTQIAPMKGAGGRRYYRPADVEILKCIKDLLYDKRLTIEGAQKELKNKGVKALIEEQVQIETVKDNLVIEDKTAVLTEIADELLKIKNDLQDALSLK